MPTRNVVVTDHQDGVISALVASGRYQNASEVLRAGLRGRADHLEFEQIDLAVEAQGHVQPARKPLGGAPSAGGGDGVAGRTGAGAAATVLAAPWD